MIDPGAATLFTAEVALLVGLSGVFASLVQSSRTAKAMVVGQLNARQVEALVTVLRRVEVQGLAVQDQIFNLTEAEYGDSDDYEPGPTPRPIVKPKRTDYAEASALVAAYGDAKVQAAFLAWSHAVDAWDARLAQLAFDWTEGDRTRARAEHVAKERDGELRTRKELGEEVNAALISLRKLR